VTEEEILLKVIDYTQSDCTTLDKATDDVRVAWFLKETFFL